MLDMHYGVLNEFAERVVRVSDSTLISAGLSIYSPVTRPHHKIVEAKWRSQKKRRASTARRKHNIVTVRGIQMTLTDACKRYNVGKSCARARIANGWDLNRVFSTQ